jgi:hypothetical protein
MNTKKHTWFQVVPIVFLVILLLAGCASTSRVNYVLTASVSGENSIEIRCMLSPSLFLSWEKTKYGTPPILFMEKIIHLELAKINIREFQIFDVKYTKYENSKYMSFSAKIETEYPVDTINYREENGVIFLEESDWVERSRKESNLYF